MFLLQWELQILYLLVYICLCLASFCTSATRTLLWVLLAPPIRPSVKFCPVLTCEIKFMTSFIYFSFHIWSCWNFPGRFYARPSASSPLLRLWLQTFLLLILASRFFHLLREKEQKIKVSLHERTCKCLRKAARARAWKSFSGWFSTSQVHYGSFYACMCVEVHHSVS